MMTQLYDHAFKYLKCQIDRLQNNLPLEDPNDTFDEHKPVPTTSGWTSYYPSMGKLCTKITFKTKIKHNVSSP